MAAQPKVDLVPTLNGYVRSRINKQEVKLSYSDYSQAIALQVTDESSHRGFVKKVLPRLAQYGYQPPGMVHQFRLMLVPSDKKDSKELLRLAAYFIQLLLGDGSAGTPAPLPSSTWNTAAPKAVDVFEDESLVPCWQHAANDKAPLNVRYASLRALAAAARASQTSQPDDSSIVMALLEAVRVALDQLHGTQQTSFVKKGRKRRAALRSAAERSGLQRAVFSAARTGLTRSSVSKIAPACMMGSTSPDKLVARHALSMAAIVAVERPQVCAQRLETPLSFNIGLFKQTGSLTVAEGQPLPFQFQAAAPESRPLNLQDTWARIYLARACGGIVYSNAVRGDVDGGAAIYWQTLVILACTDTSDLVAIEATRAMVGALTSKSVVLRTVGSAGSKQLHPRFLIDGVDPQRTALLITAWRVFITHGLANSPGQSVLAALGLDATGEEKKENKHIDASARAQAIAMQVDPVLKRLVPKFSPAPQAPVVQKVTQRLLKMLGTHSGLCTACRTVAAIAEARAAAYEHAQAEEALGTGPVLLAVEVLQERMLAVANESLPPSERVLALEALLWLQLPNHPIILAPSQMMQMMLRNGLTVPPDLRGSMPDPWPADTLSVLLHVLLKRLAVSPGLAGYIMECANVVAAVCPSRVHTEQLQLLWDTGLKHPNVQVKQAAFKGAIEMLLMQASPVTQPISQPSSRPLPEVQAFAAEEEAALRALNRVAAFWLGENTADFPWSAKPQAFNFQPSTSCPLEEQVALGGANANSLVVTVLGNLQLALLTCSWEVKVTAVQAVAKIGVRCGEPYRIQCYSILASLQGDERDISPSPLGLASIVDPSLHVMDLVYSTHMVLHQLSEKSKAGTMIILPDMIEASQSRHEWLHDLVLRRVGFIPKEAFKAGPNLAKLPEEAEDSDDDSDATENLGKDLGDSDDSDAVSMPSEADDTLEEPTSPSALAAAPNALMDILSQFTKKDRDRGDSSDDDDESVATTAAPFHRSMSDNLGDDDGEELVYPATVLYDFTSSYDEEVSVSKGEKVTVKHELGDWVQVVTARGEEGLVPADYVQLDGEAEPLQKQYSVSRWPFDASDNKTTDYAADDYNGDAAASAAEETSTSGWPYRNETADTDATSTIYGKQDEEEDTAAPRFDWFKKSDSRASRESTDNGTAAWGYDNNRESAWPYQENASPAYGKEYGTTYGKEEDNWTNDRWPAGDTAWPSAAESAWPAAESSPDSTPRGPKATSPTGYDDTPSDWPPRPSATSDRSFSANDDVTSSWPPPPLAQPSMDYNPYLAESPRVTTTSTVPPTDGFRSPVFARTTSGNSSITSPNSIGSSPSFKHPRRSVDDLPRQPSMSSSSWHAAAAASVSASTPRSSINAPVPTITADVVYAFQAEADGELTVQPGDRLTVMGEVDGWLQVVRESDKEIGLVPAEYVQLTS